MKKMDEVDEAFELIKGEFFWADIVNKYRNLPIFTDIIKYGVNLKDNEGQTF